MAKVVIVYGKSGSGKSRSLKFFEQDEYLLINVESKDLPFRKKPKYVLTGEQCVDKTTNTFSIDKVIEKFNKMPCKVGIVDDSTYIMTQHFMKNHKVKKGNAQFEMYNDIADLLYFLIDRCKKEVPDDKIIYVMMHEETSEYGSTKIKTLGKLLDDKVMIEGMVTVVIRCMSDSGKHFFRLVTDGTDITKAPEEMFETEEMDNNLKEVDTKIREYYGLIPEEKGEETNA